MAMAREEEEAEEEEEEEEEEESCEEQLPAFNDLVQRFSLFSASPYCNTQIGHGGSYICNCKGCAEWHAFVEGKSPDLKEVQYEVFTLEHVKGLAHYLKMQAVQYKLPLMKVLEVGAGNGRLCRCLTYFLAQPSLSSQGCVVQLTATDSGDRGLNGPKVLKQDAIEAISQVMPHVVLVSWMPLGVDWTAHMRTTSSVVEYILIGEIDGGICGDPWLTWGYTGDDDYSSDSSFEDLDNPCRTGGEARSTSELPFKVNNFSNYGPGRPVSLETETKISPAQPSSRQGFSLEPFLCSTVAGTEGRDVGKAPNAEDTQVVGGTQNPKRLRLGPEDSMDKNCKSGEFFTAISRPMSLSALARINDSHKNTDRKNVVPQIAPYSLDGWIRTEITPLSAVQICRTDERWSTHQHSHTVSFRRLRPGNLQHENNKDD